MVTIVSACKLAGAGCPRRTQARPSRLTRITATVSIKALRPNDSASSPDNINANGQPCSAWPGCASSLSQRAKRAAGARGVAYGKRIGACCSRPVMGAASGSNRRTFQNAPQIESAKMTAVASCKRKTLFQAAGRPCQAAARTTHAGPIRQMTGLMWTRSEIKGAPTRERRASSLALHGAAIEGISGSLMLICANLALSPETKSAAQRNDCRLYHKASPMSVSSHREHCGACQVGRLARTASSTDQSLSCDILRRSAPAARAGWRCRGVWRPCR